MNDSAEQCRYYSPLVSAGGTTHSYGHRVVPGLELVDRHTKSGLGCLVAEMPLASGLFWNSVLVKTGAGCRLLLVRLGRD